MPASVGVFEGLMTTIDKALGDFITVYSGNLAASLGPVFLICLSLYFVFWGYGIWSGRRGLTGGEILGSILRVGFVGMLVLSSSIYSTQIAANVMHIGEGMVVGMNVKGSKSSTSKTMNAKGSKSSTSKTMGAIDEIFIQVKGTSTKVMDKGGWFSGTIVGGVLLLIGLALSGYIFFLIMISKMGLAVLLAIGPIVIIFYLFDGTKQIVALWINQIIGTIFTLLFAVLGGGVVLGILAKSILIPDTGAMSAGLTQIAVIGVSGMFMGQVGGFASAVSGGVTSTVSGLKDSFKGAGNAIASPKTVIDKGQQLKAAAQGKMNKILKG